MLDGGPDIGGGHLLIDNIRDDVAAIPPLAHQDAGCKRRIAGFGLFGRGQIPAAHPLDHVCWQDIQDVAYLRPLEVQTGGSFDFPVPMQKALPFNQGQRLEVCKVARVHL